MSSYLMGELKHEAFVAEIVVNYAEFPSGRAEARSVCRGICRELCLVTWCESWSTKRLSRNLSWTMSSYLMGELKHEAFAAEFVVNYV